MTDYRIRAGAFIALVLVIAAMFAAPVSATKPEKVYVCHAAGQANEPANWVTLHVPANEGGYPQGHFTEGGTPEAGHEQDYLGECIEPTAEPTPTPTPTPTATPEPTATPTPTPEPTATPTAEPTPTPTATPSVLPTVEPTPEPTAEPTPQPRLTPPPSDTEPEPVGFSEPWMTGYFILGLMAAIGLIGGNELVKRRQR